MQIRRSGDNYWRNALIKNDNNDIENLFLASFDYFLHNTVKKKRFVIRIGKALMYRMIKKRNN